MNAMVLEGECSCGVAWAAYDEASSLNLVQHAVTHGMRNPKHVVIVFNPNMAEVTK